MPLGDAAILTFGIVLQIGTSMDDEVPATPVVFRTIEPERLFLARFSFKMVQRIEPYFCVTHGTVRSAFHRKMPLFDASDADAALTCRTKMVATEATELNEATVLTYP